MALGFNFTLKEECKMEIAKVLSLRFMSHYGKGKKPFSGYFSNRAVKKIDVKTCMQWKSIDGIDGYKFKIEDGELKCINAKNEASVSEKDNSYGSTYFSFCNQGAKKKDRSILTLRLAYCLQYGIHIDDERVKRKRFCGTVENPEIKKPKYETKAE